MLPHACVFVVANKSSVHDAPAGRPAAPCRTLDLTVAMSAVRPARVGLRRHRLIWVAVLLAGCGGGGGGGSSTPASANIAAGLGVAATSGPGDTSGYFPLYSSFTWNYNVLTPQASGVTTSAIDTVSVAGPVQLGYTGATALRTASTDPTARTTLDYFSVTGGGVTYFGDNNAADTLTPMITPQTILKFPLQLGTVSHITGSALPLVIASASGTIDLDILTSVAAFESVNVPAGTFANAAKVVQTTSSTVRAGTSSAPISDVTTRWYAPGVGLVRQVDTTTTSAGSTTVTEEMRGYTGANGAVGIGPVSTAAANTGPFRSNGAVVNVSSQLSFTNSRAVASSQGAGTLVVYPSVTGPANAAGQTPVIYAAVLLDYYGTPTPVTPLSAAATLLPANPNGALAADGNNYVFVYAAPAQPNNACQDLNNFYAQRISQTGALVDPNPVLLLQAHGCAPTLAFDGQNYLLVYGDGAQYSGTLFSPALTTSVAPFVIFAPAVGVGNFAPSDPGSLLFDGSHYFFVAQDGNGVFGVRIAPTGTVLDPAPGIRIQDTNFAGIGAYLLHPRAAFDGSNALVVWEDQRATLTTAANSLVTRTDIYGARVSALGVLLDGSPAAAGFPITSAAADTLKLDPAVVYTNGEFLLSWSATVQTTAQSPNQPGPFAIYGARVSSQGQVLNSDPGGFAISALPAVAVPSGSFQSVLGNEGYVAPVLSTALPMSGAIAVWGAMPQGIGTGGPYLLQSARISQFAH